MRPTFAAIQNLCNDIAARPLDKKACKEKHKQLLGHWQSITALHRNSGPDELAFKASSKLIRKDNPGPKDLLSIANYITERINRDDEMNRNYIFKS
ncbi:hypothetical protein [Lacisediminimonas profundi]|uniref:hypothetical protein n=1 Tax=Lacisediminimonas profundi TaxID=2603856 RepID=UPI00124B7793|nr:hypothetical protein [Lacisediminimonas profundi]